MHSIPHLLSLKFTPYFTDALKPLFFFSSFNSLIAQLVKNPSAMQETLVQFLDREDPREKG